MALVNIDNQTEKVVSKLQELINDIVQDDKPLTETDVLRLSVTVTYMLLGTQADKQTIFAEALADAKNKLVEQILPDWKK